MWVYRGEEFLQADDKIESFVYKITHIPSGKYYIGKKNFWRVEKLKPLKGRINKRHRRKETDWKDYYGSSEFLLSDIEKQGTDKFSREILVLCSKRSIATYFELYIQIQRNVLFDDNSYNNIINIRLNGNIFKNNLDECNTILQTLNKKV